MPTDIDSILEGLRFSRAYTKRLLESIPTSDWFRMPAEGVTHVAWQIGHLAMADYRLALERVRGRRPEDEALIDEPFLQLFNRDSVPDPTPARYPPPEQIRAVFERVRERVLREVPALRLEDLDAPPLQPHRLCASKRECLLWCGRHEMVHAGQIGLLRRLLGQQPLW